MLESLMPSLKVYLFAVFALTVFGMGSASADNNTDGDENNDLFIIHLLSPELYSESILTIYNRWGHVVFISKQYGMNSDWWDGTYLNTKQNLNTGTYYYTLELFHNTKEEKDLFSGYVEILNDPN